MASPVYVIGQQQPYVQGQVITYNQISPGSAQVIQQPLPQLNSVIAPVGQLQYVYVTDPMTELANCTGAKIKQQPEFFEVFTGCETANRYHVFGLSNLGIKYLFKCQEMSDYCMRNCCAASMREFSMDIKHIAASDQLMNSSLVKSFGYINKPFKCTCCCCNRPEMQVSLAETGQIIGNIYQPFNCCDPYFQILDGTGNLKYIITADCCQCALLCSNNLCGKCSEGEFKIFSNKNDGRPVGSIIKTCASSYSELVTSADSYNINFPLDASPSEKFLIIALGLMIDYQYFEESASNKGNNGGYYRYGYGYGGYGYRRGYYY